MDAATPLAVPGSFELSGQAALDFANTWGDRGRPDTDLMGVYPALLAFARQAGLLPPTAIAGLAERAVAQPEAAAAALARAKRLREQLYRLLAGRARDRGLDPADLEGFNQSLGEALARLRIESCDGRLDWAWPDAAQRLEAPLWPVLRAAADLLTSADLARVRECDGSACTWLFLDRSRGGSRRWCSMASCGNRAKARRHYRRRSGGLPPGAGP